MEYIPLIWCRVHMFSLYLSLSHCETVYLSPFQCAEPTIVPPVVLHQFESFPPIYEPPLRVHRVWILLSIFCFFFFKEKTNKIPLRLLLCACTRLLFLSLCGVIPRRVSEIAFVSLRAPSSLSLRAVSTDPHWFNNFAFCSVLIFYPPVL